MTDLEKAMEAASTYEDAVARHREDIANQPDELILQGIASMTKVLETHKQKRVELEAIHRARLDELRDHFGKEKATVNASIQSLERQLSELRGTWARMCDEETQLIGEEKARWERLDKAQRKLIAAEDRMIQELRG